MRHAWRGCVRPTRARLHADIIDMESGRPVSIGGRTEFDPHRLPRVAAQIDHGLLPHARRIPIGDV